MHSVRSLTVASLTAFVLPFVSATPAQAAERPSNVPKGAITAKVVKIVDGDTIDVLRQGKKMRVRLLEVDTPERGQCWFGAATEKTAQLLALGKKVYLLRDKDPKDHYGRWLFYVFNAKGVHVNRYLVRHGYGKAVLYKPNDRYIKQMRAEEAKAKKQKLRIWSGKCDKRPAPKPSVFQIKPQ